MAQVEIQISHFGLPQCDAVAVGLEVAGIFSRLNEAQILAHLIQSKLPTTSTVKFLLFELIHSR